MRIFMTGATGYIGSAVATTLRRGGHEVSALVRPQSDQAVLRKEGVALVQSDLDSIENLGNVIDSHDVFLHSAVADDEQTVRLDSQAIEAALGSKTGRFIYTSGVWVLGDTGNHVADEDSEPAPFAHTLWRATHEQRVLQAGRDGQATAVLRPGCVYGGKQSLLASWFSSATHGDPIRIPGDGRNRWAMVELSDLAECYRLLIESDAGGIFHATDDSRATLREMAEGVAHIAGTGSEIRLVPIAEARRQLGASTEALAADQQVSSEKTRRAIGWQPRTKTFLTSLEQQWQEFGDALQ